MSKNCSLSKYEESVKKCKKGPGRTLPFYINVGNCKRYHGVRESKAFRGVYVMGVPLLRRLVCITYLSSLTNISNIN